ncbi:disease resistance protein Pik-2-like [Lolium rigidum]|uniref:disease resistance protein Pik-2-like n=1 Tax=Lolium rigidum TaxID=89674 RepID=UPI001F5CC7A4|nr:disease resistance protein Pik-2-like [Lolium rigidum]
MLEPYEATIGRCGGIPKVIATIGQFAAKEIADDNSHRKILSDITDDFMGMLKTNQGCHMLRDLFSWMQSYFERCSEASDSLKPCIFYMSIFPRNHNIRRSHLLRRWIAEGYCRDTCSGTAVENGKKLFLELTNLSIIQQCQKAMKYLYQVNGFFHEYIISQPMEDNLVFFALEGNCSLNSQNGGQHLTIRSNWDRDITVFRSLDFSRLRSLTVFGKWMPFFLSSNMTILRVLDMSETSGILDGDLEQIAKVLPRLKFLSLRGCKEISHLPESFGGLRQLQTLDVRHTSIVMLPLCIIKLQKLKYVRAGTIIPSDEGDESVASILTTNVHPTSTPPVGTDDMVTTLPQTADEVQASTQWSWSCRPRSLVSSWLTKLHRHRVDNDGVEVPVGIGNLTGLHTIGVVNANIPNGKEILKKLKNLTQLRKLGVSGINRRNIQELCTFISGHGHLESLSARIDKDKQGLFACFDDMISQPPKTLKSLKIYGHVKKLPIWIKQLDNLQKIDLELTILLQEDMRFLGGMPYTDFLRRLCIKPIQDAELHFSTLGDGVFWELRFLEIHCTSKLHVTFVDWGTQRVEVLKIHCSGGASLRISGLEYLDLKELWLKGSYSDEIKQELQQQVSEHANKPVLKLVQRCSS